MLDYPVIIYTLNITRVEGRYAEQQTCLSISLCSSAGIDVYRSYFVPTRKACAVRFNPRTYPPQDMVNNETQNKETERTHKQGVDTEFG